MPSPSAEPTSRESLEHRIKRIAKVMGDGGYCSYLAIEDILRPEMNAVARAAKLEALEKLEVREMRVALQRIANNDYGWSDCECECGDDPDCCEKVDEWCPHCIAQTALQREERKRTVRMPAGVPAEKP